MFQEYIEELKGLLSSVKCTTQGTDILTEFAVTDVIRIIAQVKENRKKIIWVGNGGSAAIASHSATDYFRTDNIKTLCFSDASLLTCMGNDLGYESVFSQPIKLHAEDGDLLVAISSSGQSSNILNAVNAAEHNGCQIVTLSGFSEDNPLRQKGEINFYVPSTVYGYVELVHGVLCHSFLDIIMKMKER
ncbi:SIS domain-containing protein [Anaeroarcus burkinensis]|uniref:SIS domain-containing protein n=1 Tax=Anaeroarcus burkinensis TaxID=82376 RepID=UPI001AEBE4A6|nr:SIS domain-containing protein [Anaeroarcus burkinensis]